jgi:hypothetical protein
MAVLVTVIAMRRGSAPNALTVGKPAAPDDVPPTASAASSAGNVVSTGQQLPVWSSQAHFTQGHSATIGAQTRTGNPESDDLTLEQRRRLAKIRREERRRENIQRIESENTDFNWAVPTEGAIRTVIQNLDPTEFPSTRLVSARCKSSACEVVVGHGSRQESRRFPYRFKVRGREIGHKYGIKDAQPDGTYRTTVYLTREGHKAL